MTQAKISPVVAERLGLEASETGFTPGEGVELKVVLQRGASTQVISAIECLEPTDDGWFVHLEDGNRVIWFPDDAVIFLEASGVKKGGSNSRTGFV